MLCRVRAYSRPGLPRPTTRWRPLTYGALTATDDAEVVDEITDEARDKVDLPLSSGADLNSAEDRVVTGLSGPVDR